MKKIITTLFILSGVLFFSGNLQAAEDADLNSALDVLLKANIATQTDVSYYKENAINEKGIFCDKDKVLGLIVAAVKKLSGKSAVTEAEAVAYLGENKIVNPKYWDAVALKNKKPSGQATRMLIIRLAQAASAQ